MAGASRLAVSSLRQTQRKNSDVDNLIIQFNRLATLVSWMMPGILTSDPASKAGTTSALTWRTEIFTFTFRGLNVTTAAQEKGFTDNTHDVAAEKEAWFVLSVQSNGTSFTITKASDQTIGTVVLPTIPDNEVPVGFLQIVTGVTGWAATADDLAADGAKIASFAFTDAPYVTLIGNLAGAQRTATV